MDRLTIRWEDGDEIYYALAKDPEGAYDIFDLARDAEEGDGEEAGILLDISNRLAAYEDTGLLPEEIERLKISDASKEQSSIDYYGEVRWLRDEVAAFKTENERLRKNERQRLAAWEEYHRLVEKLQSKKALRIEPMYFCAKCAKELNIKEKTDEQAD